MTLILSLVGAAVLAVFVVTFIGVRHMTTISEGPAIAQNRNASALLIIDMQSCYTANQPDAPRVIDAINQLKTAWAERPTVWIRNVFDVASTKFLGRLFARGAGMASPPGIDVDPRLGTPETIIDKGVGDAFSAPELNAELASKDVGTLYLAGLMGTDCVQRTAHGALNRGYQVFVVEDAIVEGGAKRWQAAREALVARGVQFTTVADVAG